ncbi:hypothetical protein CQW23_18380 [Capsicum baccatum]|uniref:F-box associated beta-propeller type 3 domain-containing protein n=1 Tax=Capsicum baccatum TaxID=33114 RepID=A0A2G2W2R0_CAPBA|nr:hypothetical protein CQW23_18380 [Capsicum baccatum]
MTTILPVTSKLPVSPSSSSLGPLIIMFEIFPTLYKRYVEMIEIFRTLYKRYGEMIEIFPTLYKIYNEMIEIFPTLYSVGTGRTWVPNSRVGHKIPKIELSNRIEKFDNCFCDGLVLIKFLDLRTDKVILLLWNPSTKESVELSLPKLVPLKHCICSMGYDTTSNDYKIVMINLTRFAHGAISTEVLALKSGGSWRSCEYPTHISRVQGVWDWDCGMDYFAFIHGAFHWVGRRLSQCYIVVSLNISNEVYGEIPLLDQMCLNFDRKKLTDVLDLGVSTLEGMLCFYSTYYKGGEGSFKLW